MARTWATRFGNGVDLRWLCSCGQSWRPGRRLRFGRETDLSARPSVAVKARCAASNSSARPASQLRLAADPEVTGKTVRSGRDEPGPPCHCTQRRGTQRRGSRRARSDAARRHVWSARPGGQVRRPAAAAAGARRRRWPGDGARGCERRRDAAVPRSAAPGLAGRSARHRAGDSAGLAQALSGPRRPGDRRRAGRLRPDRLRVRAVPARPGDRVLHDHRPAGTGLAVDHAAAGRGRDHRVADQPRAQRAVRRDVPGLHFPHRVGSWDADQGDPGELAGRRGSRRPCRIRA